MVYVIDGKAIKIIFTDHLTIILQTTATTPQILIIIIVQLFEKINKQ